MKNTKHISFPKATTTIKNRWTKRKRRLNGLYYGNPRITTWNGDIANEINKK